MAAWLANLSGVEIVGTLVAAAVLYKGVRAVKGAWWSLALYRTQPAYFHDKVVWITGASSGIGKELALQLARAAKSNGLKVILSSRRRDALEEVKESLTKGAGMRDADVAVVTLDLMDKDSLGHAVEAAFACFGRVDILCNNAGVSQRSLARMTRIEVYEKLMTIDYVGQLFLTQQYVSKVVDQGKGASGHVVQVSSVAGKIPAPFRSGYCAAKAALNAYSDVLRLELELEKVDIAVTVISPGGVQTDVSSNALDQDGKAFGTADQVTTQGMRVEKCVAWMLTAISNRLEDVCICSNLELFATKLFAFLPVGKATAVIKPKYQAYMDKTLNQVKSKAGIETWNRKLKGSS